MAWLKRPRFRAAKVAGLSPGRRVALFYAALFTATGVSGAFLPLWFADHGLSAAAIGRVLGLAALLRVLVAPGWGVVADRIGRRRPVLSAAAIGAAVAAASYSPMRGFWPILAVAACLAVAASALSPLCDSLALALTREGRMDYGPVRAAGSLSYMLATACGGTLLAATGTGVVPWLLAAAYAGCAVVAPMLPEAARAPAGPRPVGGFRLLRLPAFRLTVTASALIQGAHAAYYAFAPLFWRAQGLSTATIGLLIAEGIIAEIALFAWGRRLVDALRPAGLTACAAAASALRWAVLAAAPAVPVLIVLQLLHAATFGMQHLSAMMSLSRAVPPERAATAQALHSALGLGAPTALLTLAAGALYVQGHGLAFLAMAAVGGAALPLAPPLARALRPAQ